MLPELMRRIEAADAISFDVFDTLFVRPLADPEDLFDLIGERFGIPQFRRLRQQAQTRAFERMKAAGRREITLDDIYACFDAVSVPAEQLRDAEYALELELTLPNPRLMPVFKAWAGKKPVVVTSDMYLPRAFFDDLLKRHGLEPHAVFVSSERNATKRDSGELFDLVKDELGIPAPHILHIGDNRVSDVERAQQKGFAAYHYVDPLAAGVRRETSTSGSIASALMRSVDDAPEHGSFTELGYRYGGPAAVGFLDWIVREAHTDRIDRILFVSRDGHILDQLAREMPEATLPSFSYFKGSRVAFTLAATDERNFDAQMQFFLSGAYGLRPIELLERLGVTPPSDAVMDGVGLGENFVIDKDNLARAADFLSASRVDILKVCRRNRRGLFSYLLAAGVKPGERIAMIDVGWNGTTQDALSEVLAQLLDVELFGYYLCLSDTEDCLRRQKRLNMKALFSTATLGAERLKAVYTNRVAIELFFSAPHDAVIGYALEPKGTVTVVEDAGRIVVREHATVSQEIAAGIQQFSNDFRSLCARIGITPDPLGSAMPIASFAANIEPEALRLLASVENFDAWASTRNATVGLASYLLG
ncbi:HAD-IA family hydrolase [Paraburkholderia sp. J94]|uniref:HAD family hydrolase n=1 Tax=Paraburkholderia sp. J94 TaxID=2805441 RepID=UPI002AB216E5|nr:HAD-IA family hydrolase [Paraburkholderia sp. J94]